MPVASISKKNSPPITNDEDEITEEEQPFNSSHIIDEDIIDEDIIDKDIIDKGKSSHLHNSNMSEPENPPMQYLGEVSKEYCAPIIIVSIFWILISKEIEDKNLEEGDAIYFDILNAYSLRLFFTLVHMPSIIKFTTDIVSKIVNKLDFVATVTFFKTIGLALSSTYTELKKIECLNNELDDKGKEILRLLTYYPIINNSLLIILLMDFATNIGKDNRNIHLGEKKDELRMEKYVFPVFSSILSTTFSVFALVSNPLQLMSLIQREKIDACPNSLSDSRDEILLSMATLAATFGAVIFNGIPGRLAQNAVEDARSNKQSNTLEKFLCISTAIALSVLSIKFIAFDEKDTRYTPALPLAFAVIHALLTTATISACKRLGISSRQEVSTVLSSRAEKKDDKKIDEVEKKEVKEVEVKKVEVKEEGVIGSRSDDNIGNDRGNEPSNNLEVEFKKDDSYQGNDLDDIDPDSSPIISEVEALGGGKELKEDSKKASVTGGVFRKAKKIFEEGGDSISR